MLRAVHTSNFPEILRRLRASLLVTTYQAGKLVMVRDEGDTLHPVPATLPGPPPRAIDAVRLEVRAPDLLPWRIAQTEPAHPGFPAATRSRAAFMALLSLRNVSLAFGGPRLLDQVELQIEPGERGLLAGSQR